MRAARIDNEYSESEKNEIDKTLMTKFSMTRLKAKEIRSAGECLESDTIDTVQLTREIKKDIPFEYRRALAEDLWSIILADTKRTDDENSFMRTCIKLIGVNDVDSAKARQAVINLIKTPLLDFLYLFNSLFIRLHPQIIDSLLAIAIFFVNLIILIVGISPSIPVIELIT